MTLTAGTITAQNVTGSLSAASGTVTSRVSSVDSLQRVIDSLQNAIVNMEVQNREQRQAFERLRAEADSLRQYCSCDMTYVLNYGNALLYRKCNARVEDIANLLAVAPDSLKQKDWEQTMTLARKMVQASNVSQDIRNRVFELLESVPQSELFAEDIREVLRNVPAGMRLEQNLTEQAISLIDAMPRSVTESDNRYAIVRELLEAYPSASEEVKTVLQSVQNHPDNSINIADSRQTFVNMIKSTQYYKRYYGKPWTIPYLNTVINEAITRLQNATSRVNLDDLIQQL